VRPKRSFLFYLAATALVGLMLVIVSGDSGLMDLFALRIERDGIVADNEQTFNENISLYRQIDRLKNDPRFIAATARKELGLVGDDELIFELK
jgi:cell division protein FtsB